MEYLDEKIRRLYKQGLKQKEIADQVGISQQYVSRLMKKFGIKAKNHSERHRQLIDLTPTPNLAYIVGALKGDGDVVDRPDSRHYFLRLRVASKPFAESFKKAVKKQGLHPNMWFTENDHKGIYTVTAASQQFVRWYPKLNLTKFLKNKKLQIAFLRGFYEAEGGCYKRTIGIYNTDIKLMDFIVSILKQWGFHPKTYLQTKNRKTPYIQLNLHRRMEAEKFLNLINPCIKNWIHPCVS